MDQQKGVYPPNGILFNPKNEWYDDTSLWVNLKNIMLREEDSHILYNSTYIKYLDQTNLRRQRRDLQLPGMEDGSHW